jgi:hypothetical protein
MIIENFHKIDGFMINTNYSTIKINTFSQTLVTDDERTQKQVRTYMGIADVFRKGVNNGYSFPSERFDLHLIVPYYEGGMEKVKVKLKQQQSTKKIEHVCDLSTIKTIDRFKHLLVTIFTKHS